MRSSSCSFFTACDQRQLPSLRTLQQHAGRQEAIDFVRAFKDAIDARVAIGALHRVVLVVAVAAVNLHALIDHVVEHLGSEDLDEAALGCELLGGLQQ